MMKNITGIYIVITIILTVYSQLIIKWRISLAGYLPESNSGKVFYFMKLLYDPYIISALIGVVIAGLCWIAAMTKFDLSYAYPFVGLTFALVLIFSAIFFHEPINLYKIAGVIMIIAGIVVSSRGM